MTPSLEPQRYRFVVATAEEAVSVLRKRFGTSARVVSVKQVEGAGLARFLQAPKLEVIAEVTPEPEPEPELMAPAAPVMQMPREFVPPRPEIPRIPSPNAVRPSISLPVYAPPSIPEAEPEPEPEPAPAPIIRQVPVPAPAPAPAPAPRMPESRLPMLLKAGGLPPSLIARWQAKPEWAELERLPTAMGLVRAGQWLREEFERLPYRKVSERVAFIGTPGAGKTTALCKRLATEVFCFGQRAAVLKLDLGQPNPGDGLAVYCSALGVPCARDVADVPALDPGQSLLIDVPGLPLGNQAAAKELCGALDMLFASTRVMVINAAYEIGLIKAAYDFAISLEATHVVFTHLDEIQHWGKLWELVLHPGLTPLFLSTGQNIAGECELNVFDALLGRTFPGLASLQANRSDLVAA